MTIEEFIQRFRWPLAAIGAICAAVMIWAIVTIEEVDDPDIAKCEADGGTAVIFYADNGTRNLKWCELP